MGLLDLFGISHIVAPLSSFSELVKSLWRNIEGEKKMTDEDFVTDDNQEEQTERE